MSEANLLVLASFWELGVAAKDKLSITRQGTFERVSGLRGSWSRTFDRLDQSFTSERIQLIINQNFTRVLDSINNDTTIDDGLILRFNQLFLAYKGFCMLDSHYDSNDRHHEFGKKAWDLLNRNLAFIGEIQKKMKAVFRSKNNIYINFNNDQKTFLPLIDSPNSKDQVDFLGKGICWGISAKWCQRWVRGKEGFGARKIGELSTANMFSNGWDQPDDVRFQKKSTEMFVLMKHQNTIGSMGGQLRLAGGFMQEAMTIFSDGDQEKGYSTNSGKTEKYTYRGAATAIHTQRNQLAANKTEPFNNYATRKAADYDDIMMSARSEFKLIHAYKRDMDIGPGEFTLITAIDNMLHRITSTPNYGKSAFFVIWRAKNEIIVKRKKEEVESGHAMAIAFSLNDQKWYFMDPNYGEWRGNYDFIRNVILLVFSFYTVNNSIYQVASQRVYRLK